MGRIGIGVGAAWAACAVAGEAHAGAWIAPEGGQEILTVAWGEQGDISFSETDYYFEQPFARRLSFVAQPRLTTTEQPDADPEAEVAMGFKAALVRTPRAAAAVQAAAVWRSEGDFGCGQSGGEVRALAGISRGSRFYNIEAAYRLQSGGCVRQRVEATAGYRPNDRWLALGQAFVDHDLDGGTTIKAQASVVRFGGDTGGLQIGVRFRLDGERREPALVLGWWGAPRR